jgi:alpha-galactosidase
VFTNVLRNLDQDSTSQTALQTAPTIQAAAGPPGSSGIAWGHWNDPDYLAPELGMTSTQAQSQVSMWAMVAAPLILGSVPRTLPSATISMLENPQVIAIDQDSLGVQGSLLSRSGSGQVWVKPPGQRRPRRRAVQSRIRSAPDLDYRQRGGRTAGQLLQALEPVDQ